MKVCYVYQDEYPWDIRAEKITASLANAGIATTILSRNRRGLARRETLRPTLHIRRLPRGLSKFDRAIMNFPAFFSPFWKHALMTEVIREGASVIMVRDLPLAPLGWYVAKRCQVPVLLDMAEDYPSMLQATWEEKRPPLQDRLIRNPTLMRKLEAWVLPRLDGILTVSQASRRRVQAITGADVPVWVVGNTPRLEMVGVHEAHPIADEISNRDGLKLLYVGGLDPGRGIDVAIRAVASLARRMPGKVVFYIVGDGVTRPGLEELVRKLAVESQVKFTGFVDQKFVPALISAADIGLIPHRVTPHTDTTLPNKLYDYMAQAKPVIVTNSRSLREVVETWCCGRVYQDSDQEDLATAIIDLSDVVVRRKLGSAGESAVRQELNWSRDSLTVLEAVNAVDMRSRSR